MITMKKNYQKPKIWVEELKMESPLLGGSLINQVTNVIGNTSIGYGGGGSGPARAGENSLWDDEEDESEWGHI